jgi:hypothetical protein
MHDNRARRPPLKASVAVGCDEKIEERLKGFA